jgi:hypothetical protein
MGRIFQILKVGSLYALGFILLAICFSLLSSMIGTEGLKAVGEWINSNKLPMNIFGWCMYAVLAYYWKDIASFMGKWRGEEWEVLMREKWYLFVIMAVIVEIGGHLA